MHMTLKALQAQVSCRLDFLNKLYLKVLATTDHQWTVIFLTWREQIYFFALSG